MRRRRMKDVVQITSQMSVGSILQVVGPSFPIAEAAHGFLLSMSREFYPEVVEVIPPETKLIGQVVRR